MRVSLKHGRNPSTHRKDSRYSPQNRLGGFGGRYPGRGLVIGRGRRLPNDSGGPGALWPRIHERILGIRAGAIGVGPDRQGHGQGRLSQSQGPARGRLASGGIGMRRHHRHRPPETRRTPGVRLGLGPTGQHSVLIESPQGPARPGGRRRTGQPPFGLCTDAAFRFGFRLGA